MRIAPTSSLSLVAATALAGCLESGDPIPPSAPPVDWASLDAAVSTTQAAPGDAAAITPEATAAHFALVQNLEAALGDKDSTGFTALYTVAAVASVPGASDWHGRADIGAMMRDFYAPFAGLKATPSRVLVKGDAVAVEWVLTGTQAKSWLGTEASGKTISLPLFSVYHFDGKLVAAERTYLDEVSAIVEIGAQTQGTKGGPVVVPPSDPPVIVGAKGGADEDANTALVASTAKGFQDGNADAAVAPYAVDVEVWSNTREKPLKGKDAAKKELAELFKAFTGVKITSQETWGAGSFVVDERAITAVSSGAFAGHAATKKPVTWHTATVSEVRDGKIVRVAEYANRDEIDSALGVRFQH